ncbi:MULTISPECIES: ComC/BlpC family leader-containing pheromone/bacteriocin [unclassified Flavobacterium]|jgi:hypothetical protein|uniref:ComC/BlpC family leader-containing pheromone/bacteriocin n=1 Tax=unclassified Flavobacterium TaxID=196869 RepID=UPI000A593383|nr:ComC/BlpC family leader-containing pheromone/bacteriocin [Flavobacterium sp. ABG]
MRKVTNNLSSFEEFKLENLKSIIGGNSENNEGGGGPIDPIKRPTNGGGGRDDRPES